MSRTKRQEAWCPEVRPGGRRRGENGDFSEIVTLVGYLIAAGSAPTISAKVRALKRRVDIKSNFCPHPGHLKLKQ